MSELSDQALWWLSTIEDCLEGSLPWGRMLRIPACQTVPLSFTADIALAVAVTDASSLHVLVTEQHHCSGWPTLSPQQAVCHQAFPSSAPLYQMTSSPVSNLGVPPFYPIDGRLLPSAGRENLCKASSIVPLVSFGAAKRLMSDWVIDWGWRLTCQNCHSQGHAQ